MPQLKTPWDSRSSTDQQEVDRDGPPVVLPDVTASTHIADPVAPAAPEPRPPPRLTFEAKIDGDGSVVIPASLISPVMSMVGGWWREHPELAPPETPAPRSPDGPVAPLTDDTIVDQRIAPVPKDLYLRLARSGAFPSKRIGKRICARWADVRAAFAGMTKKPKPSVAKTKPTQSDDGLDDLRLDIGLAKKGK